MSDLVVNNLVARTAIDRRLAELVTPTIEGMGYRLVRLRLIGGGRPTLQVMAERAEGGMEVDDCAALSRALSALLDVEDPIHSQYVLEVSSPGIDRPLTRLEDFARWQGHEAKLEMAEPVEGRRRFKGCLMGVEGGDVLIESGGRRVALPFADLAEAKLVLTDALIRESLGGRGGEEGTEGFDEGAFDEIEYEDEQEDGAAAAPAYEEDE